MIKIFRELTKSLLLLVILFSLTGCAIVTRISRPTYEGTVLDAVTEEPLRGVAVNWGGEVVFTDDKGRFAFEARTYRELTFIAMEAPSLMIDFSLTKKGYCTRRIQYHNHYGGGGSPEDVWKEEIRLTPDTGQPCKEISNSRGGGNSE